jgi:hypothetical protein
MIAMNTSSLEINEREYCIKLSKDAFDLTLVRQLIKRIQAEALFFKRATEIDEDDILSKRSQREEYEGYDNLDDK